MEILVWGLVIIVGLAVLYGIFVCVLAFSVGRAVSKTTDTILDAFKGDESDRHTR